MRDFGSDPGMRKGELMREMSANVNICVETLVPKLDEFFAWQILVRGVSRSAAVGQLRDYADLLKDNFEAALAEAIAEAAYSEANKDLK